MVLSVVIVSTVVMPGKGIGVFFKCHKKCDIKLIML